MSGTSSSTSSSTSGRASRSSSSPERASMSSVSPARSFTSAQLVGQLDRPAPRRPGRRSSARVPSSRTSLSCTTSPATSGSRTMHDVEALVEHDLLAAAQRGPSVDVGADRDAHLAARANTSTVPSSLGPSERGVGRGRLGELVDLLAQRRDVVARLAQGVGELLVLADRLGELALGLEQPLLERAHPLGRVLQPPDAGRSTSSSSVARPAPAAPRPRLVASSPSFGLSMGTTSSPSLPKLHRAVRRSSGDPRRLTRRGAGLTHV